MQEKIINWVRDLLERIKDWWKKFTARQKTIIIIVAAVIIMAFAILVTVLTRPHYVPLVNCESTREASEITSLFDENGIKYEITTDGLSISVLASQESDANLLLGANNIQSNAYTIDNVTSGGFSTTESDKQKRYTVYLQTKLEKDFIEVFSAIKSAHVQLYIPENDGTLISNSEDSSAAIVLELQDEFTNDQAAYLAQAVATALGSSDASNITIMDTDGNMLYSGAEGYSVSGSATSQLNVKTQAEQMLKNEVKQVLMNTNLYDRIEVAANLNMDFATYDVTSHEYSAPDGMTQGLYSEANEYNSSSQSAGGGIPGTDSNQNGTTYVFQDDAGSSSTVSETSYRFLPNEKITREARSGGGISYTNSSLSVTAISYNMIKEQDARSMGLLDGITWSEYKAANSGRTKLEVDEDLYDVVAKATGIPNGSISILAYEENMFIDRVSTFTFTDGLQLFLIIVILALLAFVILRSMRREKGDDELEEIDVETLVSESSEPMMTIEPEVKSETRLLIEKFVDDNPELAANLLRNWLNEDWG